MPPPETAYQSQSQWIPDQRTQTNYNNWQQPPILPQEISLQPAQQQKPVYNQIQQNWPQPPMNLFPGSQQQIQHQQPMVPMVIQVPASNVVSDENNNSGGLKSIGKLLESSEGKSESNSAEEEETMTTEAPKV